MQTVDPVFGDTTGEKHATRIFDMTHSFWIQLVLLSSSILYRITYRMSSLVSTLYSLIGSVGCIDRMSLR